MAAALMLMGCAQELTSPEQEHVREVILSAEVVDADAKSAIDENGSFSWAKGDKISVWAENQTRGAFQTFTLNSGEGTNQATFRGLVIGEGMELSTCAVYPAGAHKLNGTTLSVNLPPMSASQEHRRR